MKKSFHREIFLARAKFDIATRCIVQTKKKKFFFLGVPLKMCRKIGNLHTYFLDVNFCMNFLDRLDRVQPTFFVIFLKNAGSVDAFKIIHDINS
jgi:hypothetical protein